MSTTKTKMLPVRVSEYFGGSRSAGKRPESERKKMEPERVKPILEREMELVNAARDSRKTLFALPKKTVRRTLYPGPSPARAVNSIRPSQAPQSSRVPQTKPQATKPGRVSLLPPPNSIAKKYIQLSTNIYRQSTIIKEKNTPKQVQERATVIQSVKTAEKVVEKRSPLLNQTIDINSKDLENENDANSVIEDLEESIADKENIPPPAEVHKVQPLAENKARQYDNIDILHFLGLYKSSISRMECLESSVEQITTEIRTLSDSAKRIEALLQILVNQQQNPVSVADVSSTPKILVEIASPTAPSSSNKENSSTISKKKRRSSKGLATEPRRSLRLLDKGTPVKHDSFVELERQLDIKHSNCKSAPARSKMSRMNERGKPKGERPLREYLALKASMSFLETPDSNGFRSHVPLEDSTPARQKTLRRSLSTKLFQELTDLYDDSSEQNSTDTVSESQPVD